MKLIYLAVYGAHSANPVQLAVTEDLSSFSWVQRSTYREHLVFASRLFAERTEAGSRQRIEMKDIPFFAHIHRRANGLTGVVFSDQEYPERVAFGLLNQVLKNFEEDHSPDKWQGIKEDSKLEVKSMEDDFAQFQNPREADKMSRIQDDLDQIKDIMHKNIDEVLKRGEPLERLMEKSNDLSYTSQMFATQARKNNQCCKSM